MCSESPPTVTGNGETEGSEDQEIRVSEDQDKSVGRSIKNTSTGRPRRQGDGGTRGIRISEHQKIRESR